MRKSPQAIDGFVPRRSGRSIGDVHKSSLRRLGEGSEEFKVSSSAAKSTIGTTLPPVKSISRREIDDSLKDIDDDSAAPKKRRGLFRRHKQRKPVSRRKKIIKRIIKILLVLALIVAAYVGIQAFIAGSAIFQGNLFGIFQNKPLQMDENGRTNILLFGTSGTVDDKNHDGADLTDSILVLSLDQKKKNAYMMSIPRDLWVDMGGACMAGYQAKINTMYECYAEGGEKEAAGAKKLQAKVGEVTGLEMHYYAHVNWAVVVKAVDAVGGINVDVKGNGPVPYGVKPGSVLDRNFDGACNYTCYFVKYGPGRHHMDGNHALAFSRARNANGGYGFARGNFDREVNQQKVLVALKNKATSAGTLTNLGKVTSLINALGENLRTSFDTSEIRTLMSLAQDIPADKIQSVSFVDEKEPLMTTGMVAGQSIVQPIIGLFDYSQIHAYVNKKVNASEVTREKAKLALYNGNGIAGFASEEADKLAAKGFTVAVVDNAPEADYDKVEVYQISGKKPATKKKLEQIYHTKVKKADPPFNVPTGIHFLVIYGKAPSAD